MDKFLLQSRFQQLHKARVDQPTTSHEARKEELKDHRKSTRTNIMATKRNINVEMSPFHELPEECSAAKKPTLLEQKMEACRQQLKLWQEEKKKRIQQQKLCTKPLFKVQHVKAPVGAADLENINKLIKGKKFNPSKTTKEPIKQSYNFAPADYKFKGPQNIHPLKTSQSTNKLKRQPAIDLSFKQNSIKPDNKKVLFNPNTVTKASSGPQYKKTPAKSKVSRKLAEEVSSGSSTIATRLRSKTNSTRNDEKPPKTAVKTPKNNKKTQAPKGELKRTESKANLASNDEKPSKTALEALKNNKKTKSRKDLKKMDDVKIVFTNPSEDGVLDKENERSGQKAQTPRKSRSYVDEESPTKMRKMTKTEPPSKNSKKTPAKQRKSILAELNSTNTPEKNENVQEPAENSTNKPQTLTPRDEVKTPKNKTPNTQEKPLAYISPFVTISRGKTSAREEFHMRSMQGGLFDLSPELKKATGTEAAAEYFHQLLDDEIKRIQDLCDEWNQYKEEKNPPEDACDMINMAVGQSQLLISKKFKQFRGLITDCETGEAEPPITCTDLHGYWDTAYIQVDNLDKRFENLAKLRKNNWEEILPVKKEEVKKDEVKKGTKRGRKPKVQATSSLRDLIKAKRQKATKQVETAATVDEEPETPQKMLKVATPVKSARSVGRPRNSMRASVLTAEASKRVSSPGLIIMRVAHTAKSVEKRADNLSDTPARSILKPQNSKSTTKKSVLFKEDQEEENSPPAFISNGCFSPQIEDSGRRKSARLSRTKLF